MGKASVNFQMALKAIKEGKFVRRKHWNGQTIFLNKKNISMSTGTGARLDVFNPSNEDILALDWEIVKPINAVKLK